MQQSEVIDFLMRPESYGLSANAKVQRFDTHISVVFLAGEYAYKLKRAIELPFVDFRDLSDREKYCRLELVVNKAGASDLYIDAVPVVSTPDGLSLDGTGDVVDWLVKMHCFDQCMLFDGLADERGLTPKDMDRLTDHVVDCYQVAETHNDYGGREGMERAFAGHYKAFENCPPHVLEGDKLDQLRTQVTREIEKIGDFLNDRQQAGYVRQCHGDLHLRNICFYKGKITLFDAIEFEPDYAIIDVFYDFCFLLMDLCHRGEWALANTALNRYLGRTGDVAALHVLGLFLASRASIRTHVNAVASQNQKDEKERLRWEADAQKYLDEALIYMEPKPVMILAIGGYSGSGKSTLAKKLAPEMGRQPGAFIARTDMIRKRIMRVKPEEKLNEYGYRDPVTKLTYNTLYVEIRQALHAGTCVIVDGVFAKEEERIALEKIASELDVPFFGLWLDVEPQLLKDRVALRSNDPSDADEQVVEVQLTYDVGNITWTRLQADHDLKYLSEKVIELVKNKAVFSWSSPK